MSVVQGKQIPVEILGGLVTNIDSQALPVGVSPDCADVAFKPGVPGTVQTRPGQALVFASAGNPKWTYLTTFTDTQGNNRNLYLDTNGDLYQEFPQNTFTLISTVVGGSYAKSDTAFGREFIGFSDGKFGIDIPRQWDGVNLDRVSQVGPGKAPIVSDSTPSIAIASASQEGSKPIDLAFELVPNLSLVFTGFANSLHTAPGTLITVAGAGSADYDGDWITPGTVPTNGAVNFTFDFEFANPVTPTPTVGAGGTVASSYITMITSAAHGLKVGQTVIIAGVGVGYDGTYVVMTVPDATTFTYFGGATGLAPVAAGGTVELSGNISAGVHQLSVVFITREGYFTAPPQPTSWTAAGGKTATAANIPIGPPNVIARLLIATAAGGSNFFFSQSNQLGISTFLIPDNTTTSFTIDFTDLALNSSQSADLLFDRIELPEVAGMIQYADRMIAWGGRNYLQNLVNMPFDGGFSLGTGTGGGDVPLGWTSDPTSGAGGSKETSLIFGDAYGITGDGSAIRGMITQAAYQDYLGVQIIGIHTAYSVRIRHWAAIHVPATNYQITVDLYSPSLATVFGAAVITVPADTTPTESIVALMTAQATLPTDLILRTYASNTLPNGVKIELDDAEIFPTLEPYQNSVVFASNVADPEAFQGVTGFLNVNENDGRRVVSAFIIRDRLYFLKNIGGLFATTDDASNEPSGWTVDTISLRVGAETINSVGAHIGSTGEDWVFIMSREGLYVFWASEPPKASQEIQPTWDSINWQYGYKSWLHVDTANRVVLIGVPMGASTECNKILQMDYKSVGGTAAEVADGDPVRPTYTGQFRAHASARKWAIWNITASGAGSIERDNGKARTFIGSSISSSGAIRDLSEDYLTDDGTPIPGGGYYVTAFYPSDEQDQGLQIKGNRVLQRYMTLNIGGIGNLEIEAFGPGFVNSSIVPISGAPALTLTSPAAKDIETFFNFGAERISNKFTASDPSSPWWSLQNINLYLDQDPVSVIRGNN